MGFRLHLCCDDDRIEGYRHHDPKVDGWRFEMGLPYEDETVECITISHGMSQLEIYKWDAVLQDMHRVLERGGVLRITDDDNESLDSPRFAKPYPGIKSMTGPKMTRQFLSRAGFIPYEADALSTMFKDVSIIIAHRIAKPSYVYYLEGVKP